MSGLTEGASGPSVLTIQNQLQAFGFSPGALDGNFGPSTTAAVIAFQKSQGLPADGMVGVQTATALAADPPTPLAMPGITVAIVSKMFPVTPVANITANLPHVLSSLANAQLTAIPVALTALATIRAETESFEPISEYQSSFNTAPGGSPFGLYDNRQALGNGPAPDGANFRGRGYVQLTGRLNYTKYGPLAGVPNLVNQPDLANDPVIAANLLSAFIASEKQAITAALARGDLTTARRLVNGGSNGLDRFTDAYTIGKGLLA